MSRPKISFIEDGKRYSGVVLKMDIANKELVVWKGMGLYNETKVVADQVVSANWEAWQSGINWAPTYFRDGYGADQKPWGDIPETKRKDLWE